MRLTSEISSTFAECGHSYFNTYDAADAREVSEVFHSAFLALGAEMGRSLRHQQAADGRTAGDAGLAGALVNAVAELEKALAAVGIHVIGDGRAAGGDGFGEHRKNGLMEPPRAVSWQA
jgi:hypothetical protein